MRLMTGAVTMLLAAAGVSAEERPGGGGSGTTVSLQAGLGSGSMNGTTAALGGSFVQELGRHWAVEASTSFFGEDRGGDSLAVTAAALYHFRPSGERAAPYLALGGGLYHTSFHIGGGWDGQAPAGPGRNPPVAPAGMPGRGWPGGPYGPTAGAYGQMPHFYARRMAGAPDGMPPADRSFDDPALSVGAGVRIRLGQSMSLRPEGRLLVAFADDDSLTVGVVTVSFGWRF